jgi:nucleotide-binding universal stress UspA family protein
MKPLLWEVIMSYATLMVHLDLVQENDARLRVVGDLIVAGAFGHSKLREWILGGVTRDLLGQSSCCQLLAH